MPIPIVGTKPHHNPTAAALHTILPLGCRIQLHWEPDNRFDPQAIAVLLPASELKKLSAAIVQRVLGPLGYTTQQILSHEFWHLGYIPAKWPRASLPPLPVDGTLSFTARGAPQIEGV